MLPKNYDTVEASRNNCYTFIKMNFAVINYVKLISLKN